MVQQKKPLLDRLMNTSVGKVVHSTGYGRVQNPGRIGTASTQSFKERLTVDRNREFVGRYKDARVMRESRNALPQAKSYEFNGGDEAGQAKDAGGLNRGSGAVEAKANNGNNASARSGVAAAAERAQMAARFEPAKPMNSGPTPPPRINPGI